MSRMSLSMQYSLLVETASSEAGSNAGRQAARAQHVKPWPWNANACAAAYLWGMGQGTARGPTG